MSQAARSSSRQSAPTANVPCGSCTACCRNEAVPLVPEHGDQPGDYGWENLKIAKDGTIYLKVKENGECVFLGEDGCTIHEKRPAHCRVFDCRLLYLQWMNLSRADRRRLTKQYRGRIGVGPVMNEGRARLDTLENQNA